MSRVLLVISASFDPDLSRRIEAGQSPRKDYVELARAVNGTILYRDEVQRHTPARIASRVFGVACGQALVAFARRREYDAVFTDAENIGLPLALLLKLTRTRRRHVMVGHYLSSPLKRLFFRLFRLETDVDIVICHASLQRRRIERCLRVPPRQIALLPYHVDVRFWQPSPGSELRRICSVGLEFRDYRTLIEASRGLDVDVVIAAASHWSRRTNEASRVPLPPNVRVTALGYEALRTLYAESLFVVVPLHDVEFQAGITVILEAMAMGKALVVTRSRGQTDVVRGELIGRPSGAASPEAAFPCVSQAPATGDTGIYVAPGDAASLRRAIRLLLERPDQSAQMGARGRRLVERCMTTEQYVERIAALIRGPATATLSSRASR